MKIKLMILAFCLSILSASAKGPKKDRSTFKYDIECAGNGSEGTYLIKIWVYDSKPNKVTAQVLKKQAVHGVIFKGFSGKEGCTSQKPMAQSPALESEKADFFQAFFENDQTYLRYVDIVDDAVGSMKIGKEYKVGAIVSVSKDLLRKDLEKAGIIRSLSSGF